jgi:hypothetical protein
MPPYFKLWSISATEAFSIGAVTAHCRPSTLVALVASYTYRWLFLSCVNTQNSDLLRIPIYQKEFEEWLLGVSCSLFLQAESYHPNDWN